MSNVPADVTELPEFKDFPWASKLPSDVKVFWWDEQNVLVFWRPEPDLHVDFRIESKREIWRSDFWQRYGKPALASLERASQGLRAA